MAQQEPIRVVVEKKGGCFSGCGTALGVLLLIGLAIKYWYIALGIVAVIAVIAAIGRSQQKQKGGRKPGPRDPWLNEVAVALGELGLSEVARDSGNQLGGVAIEGDIGLREKNLLIYVNLFANAELARQAEIGLRAQPNVRTAVANGRTVLKANGPVLLVAHGPGGVVDEFRLNEVEHAIRGIPLPPALRSRQVPPPPLPQAPPASPVSELTAEGDPLDQIRKLAELRAAGVLSEAEFEAKKAELLRRL